uniref:phenylalanine--tRNA ligase n=1 Tax=Sexangularia sp. CB-2014 TaxID=1486929 RepID=A0A6U0I9I9_9EUKA|mmetsp:Transcript_13438/g.42343  ORF Transcript_13438/g.42343 Transcript_13438/m.42343 type:complete len:382 (+) Transcript_13438:80-1225(+)
MLRRSIASVASGSLDNVPASVRAKIGKNLHQTAGSPIHLLCQQVCNFFADRSFSVYDSLPPTVTVRDNFDSLGIPLDHVSRSADDTFYLEPRDAPRAVLEAPNTKLLRCHTSAHQTSLLRQEGLHSKFLVAGDVYRRDTIDSSHYPVFHQMEGVWLAPAGTTDEAALASLKVTLRDLVVHLLGDEADIRFVDASFPFTNPSLEVEVWWRGEWLELLGSGVIAPHILSAAGLPDTTKGWAFGLGLERLAMAMYSIPDIRLFWSDDERFTSQFARASPGDRITFSPFSRMPPVFKDVSFWLPQGGSSTVHPHDVYATVRETAGDLVEAVTHLDTFTHPKTGKVSHAYRICYRSMSRTLTNAEVNERQAELRDRLVADLGVELR